MSEQGDGEIEHDRATCPKCGMLNVTVFTSPKKPPKMQCTSCGWDSISGEQNELLPDGVIDRRCIGCGETGAIPKRKVPSDHGTSREPICDDCEDERR